MKNSSNLSFNLSVMNQICKTKNEMGILARNEVMLKMGVGDLGWEWKEWWNAQSWWQWDEKAWWRRHWVCNPRCCYICVWIPIPSTIQNQLEWKMVHKHNERRKEQTLHSWGERRLGMKRRGCCWVSGSKSTSDMSVFVINFKFNTCSAFCLRPRTCIAPSLRLVVSSFETLYFNQLKWNLKNKK